VVAFRCVRFGCDTVSVRFQTEYTIMMSSLRSTRLPSPRPNDNEIIRQNYCAHAHLCFNVSQRRDRNISFVFERGARREYFGYIFIIHLAVIRSSLYTIVVITVLGPSGETCVRELAGYTFVKIYSLAGM